MSVRVKLSATPDFKFRAFASDGTVCQIGASKSIGGDESGFRPMQLLLAALAGCSGIDAVNILKKSRVDFSSLDIEVEGDRMDDTPSPFTNIKVKFILQGSKEIDQAKAEKAVSLSLEKYCSVAASLDPSISVTASTHLLP
jgi:putative redox protein